jgi:hypothetical protein
MAATWEYVDESTPWRAGVQIDPPDALKLEALFQQTSATPVDLSLNTWVYTSPSDPYPVPQLQKFSVTNDDMHLMSCTAANGDCVLFFRNTPNPPKDKVFYYDNGWQPFHPRHASLLVDAQRFGRMGTTFFSFQDRTHYHVMFGSDGGPSYQTNVSTCQQRALHIGRMTTATKPVNPVKPIAPLDCYEEAGRQMGDDRAKECTCPISCMIMHDPVLAADGHTYEREFIQKSLARSNKSPMTNETIDSTLVENRALRKIIESFLPTDKHAPTDEPARKKAKKNNEQAAVDFGGMEVENYVAPVFNPMGYAPAGEDDAQTS